MNKVSTLSLGHEERLRVLDREVERLDRIVGELVRAEYQQRTGLDGALSIIQGLRLRVKELEDKVKRLDSTQPLY